MSPRLNTYWHMLTDSRLRAISSHHAQAMVYVAAPSQKRAAEIMGTDVRQMQMHGGMTRNKEQEALTQSEPETAFVKVSDGVYSRLDEIADPSKRIAFKVVDEERDGVVIENPAFGMVSVARTSGAGDLFMVNYPQGHAIALEIHTASIIRRDSRDSIMEDRQIARIEMSEVQWARLVSSFNTTGVPCTLLRYREPSTGEFMSPRLSHHSAADRDAYTELVSKKADQALETVDEAVAKLSEVLKGPLRKGDLNEVLDLLVKARRTAGDSLPYVAQSAHEAIDKAINSGKAEFDAHVDYAMQKLGERALGDKLTAFLKSGGDLKVLGAGVLALSAPPAVDEDPAS